jgi:hypothetical protein
MREERKKLVTFGRFYHACYQATIDGLLERMVITRKGFIVKNTTINGTFDLVQVTIDDEVSFYHGWRNVYIQPMHTIFSNMRLYQELMTDSDLEVYVKMYTAIAYSLDFPKGEEGIKEIGYDHT